ncbi:MAG: RNA polymerase sigma factor [Acidimicrobiia bacterium]
MTSEAELVERARAGDRDAFCELLERHRIVALRVGYTIAGPDAEDAVQEAMVKAYRHLDRFRPGSSFRPWFLAIVGNEARNRRRSGSRQDAVTLRLRAQTDTADARWAPSAEDGAMARVQQRRLLDAVAGLSDRDREIVALRYFAGLTEAETASALDCALGTVKSRLSRAIGRLRECLHEEVRS